MSNSSHLSIEPIRASGLLIGALVCTLPSTAQSALSTESSNWRPELRITEAYGDEETAQLVILGAEFGDGSRLKVFLGERGGITELYKAKQVLSGRKVVLEHREHKATPVQPVHRETPARKARRESYQSPPFNPLWKKGLFQQEIFTLGMRFAPQARSSRAADVQRLIFWIRGPTEWVLGYRRSAILTSLPNARHRSSASGRPVRGFSSL